MSKPKAPQLNAIDLTARIESRSHYEAELQSLQHDLFVLHRSDFMAGGRTIIVFEGWDAAGKGGTIKRLTAKLDPRGFTVYPISAPKEENQAKHYLYRFWQKLPHPGHWAIFDRSWYGRVLVERVENLCLPDRWRQAYQEINEFERGLIDDGVNIIKVFLHFSPEEQLTRFKARFRNPEKRWKLTYDDIRNREKWGDYQLAVQDMLDQTSTDYCPWHAISAEQKQFARIEALKIVRDRLREKVKVKPRLLDPKLEKQLAEALGEK